MKGMFPMKKLIIVSTEGLEAQAELFKGLVSTKDDQDGQVVGTKDGTVEVVVWDAKTYVAQKNSMSSEQNVLFIGGSKLIKSEVSALEHFEVFNQFGIKFYVHGHSAILTVEDRSTSYEEYEEFYAYCKDSGKKIQQKLELKPSENESVKTSATAAGIGVGTLRMVVGASVLATPVVVAAGAAAGSYGLFGRAKKLLNDYENKNKIIKQKYTGGVQVFYLEFLQNFLDN